MESTEQNDSAPALSSRLRLLVSRIQQEAIEPSRAEVQRLVSDLRTKQKQIETQRADHAKAQASAREEIRKRRSQAATSASSDAGRLRNELVSLWDTARAHLQRQGIAADEGTPAPAAVSSSGLQPSARPRAATAEQTLSTAAELVKEVRRIVNEDILRTAKPKQIFRPDNKPLGCWVLGIGFVVACFIGGCQAGPGGSIQVNILYFLGVLAVYTGMMWTLHYLPKTRLSLASRQLRARHAKADALLAEYAAAANATADSEHAAVEKRLIEEDAALQKRLLGETQAAETRFANQLATIENRLRPIVDELHRATAEFTAEMEFFGRDWGDNAWHDWRPASSPQLAVRFGTLSAEASDLGICFPSLNLDFEMPALAPFDEPRCLLLEPTASEKEHVTHSVQSVLTRLLASVPSGKVRFTFIDPVGLGNNVAGFMPLADHEESLVTSRAWSEPQHIEQRLSDLTEHMETVIQKYLRNEYRTIQDYNIAAKEVAEAYRFVVVFDFPVNFSDTAARRLVSIARNGPRCGVYALIVYAKGKPEPYGFQRSELTGACSVVGEAVSTATATGAKEVEASPDRLIASGVSSLRWLEGELTKWTLKFDSPPPPTMLSTVIKGIGATAHDAMRVEVPYENLLSLAELNDGSWWNGSTAKTIRVPLGPTGARKLQYLSLGEGMAHHALIVGRPGSGKSNLMHVIITSLALTYSPDEMRIYLIDFKRGVEFKSYADHRLPHAEAIAVESEREFGLSVVERLDAELKARGDLFRAAGAANVTEYRDKTKAQIPRILLIVDEFQEFFTQDDHVARQVTLILDRLVRQGRAFGIHIMLGSQTLAGSYNLSKSTLDQMAVRIAMQCSEADSRLVLADDNPAARLLSRPGEAIYNAASGLVEGNNLFQVARFNDEDREERLNQITNIAKRSGKPVRVPVIFEGNELARLEDCRSLQELLTASEWPVKRSIELLLGDPIAIRDPIAARVRRQSGNNLLILSRDEAEGVGMCVASILSVLAQQPPGTVRILIADFTLADSDWAERAEEIEEFFPHDVKVLSKQRAVAEAVKELSDEVKRRIDSPEKSSVFLVLQGLQRMKVLRTEEDSFRYEDDSSTPAELLAYILREGPETGVHVIAWCDTYPNAGRVADRRTMNEFGLRAGGVMSADDSMSFFDDAAASRIDKPHRVLFFEEERPGQLDKFRPYSMPPREWLKTTGAQMRARVKT